MLGRVSPASWHCAGSVLCSAESVLRAVIVLYSQGQGWASTVPARRTELCRCGNQSCELALCWLSLVQQSPSCCKKNTHYSSIGTLSPAERQIKVSLTKKMRKRWKSWKKLKTMKKVWKKFQIWFSNFFKLFFKLFSIFSKIFQFFPVFSRIFCFFSVNLEVFLIFLEILQVFFLKLNNLDFGKMWFFWRQNPDISGFCLILHPFEQFDCQKHKNNDFSDFENQ